MEVEHQNEVRDYESKIKKLENEKNKAREKGNCMDCGKTVTTILFCDEKCQENAIQ